MRKTRLALLTLALAALPLLAPGCTALGLGPQRAPGNAAELAQYVYPKDAKYGPDLDILAVREGETLELVNRTTAAYHNVQVWLNEQYVLPVKAVAIGRSDDNRLSMGSFVNEYAEPYPLGGLLTPDRDMPLVQAIMFDPATGTRYRLVVRN